MDIVGAEDDNVRVGNFGESFVIGVVEGSFGIEFSEEVGEDFTGVGLVVVGVEPDSGFGFVRFIGDGCDVEFFERLVL